MSKTRRIPGKKAQKSINRTPLPLGIAPSLWKAQLLGVVSANHINFFNLGLCMEQQGRRQEAIDSYRKALVINPGHKRAREALEKLAQRELGNKNPSKPKEM